MKKTLHITLVALLSTFALGVYAQETVIWEEDWQSSEKNKLVNEVTNPNAVYIINTTAGAAPKYMQLYVKTGTDNDLELLMPHAGRGETWTVKINDLKGKTGDFKLSYKYNQDNFSITSSTTGVIISDIDKAGAMIKVPAGTGSLELTFSNQQASTNGRIDNIKLVAGATAEVYPEVANIAELKALGDGAKAILTLTNARVNFVNGKDMYVEDATGAIDFYDCKLEYTAGQVLNGTIKVKEYKLYNKLPEITIVSDNNLVATDGEAVPTEVAIEAINDAMVCRLVKVSGKVATAEEEYTDNSGATQKRTNYFLEDEDENSVQFYRKWQSLEGTDLSGLVSGDNVTLTGIVVFLKNVPAIGVTGLSKNATNGITDVSTDNESNAPTYNIAGQRVENVVRGIYIRNGKKFVVK
ncbi:MAG: hypothetical protein SOZ80_05600 [Prevotella sp.]|uniref:hypothetical protein n=1 Tax=Prevotella sp. TaxID=59823 RepID=UPI002A32E2FA|nr:hypothetical protein [Prevotella sp.]MDD7318413.1 hypothetical protein [Prevotellaceae bacterium]MDY4020236.1 hypothetical protein [Prevotella sp.]